MLWLFGFCQPPGLFVGCEIDQIFKQRLHCPPLWVGLVLVPGAVVALMALYGLLGSPDAAMTESLWKGSRLIGGTALFFAVMVALRHPINARTPSLELMDDLMYKAIAVGFAFFTIATVLGAFWAAEAWGGYWSWDPKETWALIVWLNYAAWLHMRLMKGLRGTVAAWWALVGLAVTTTTRRWHRQNAAPPGTPQASGVAWP